MNESHNQIAPASARVSEEEMAKRLNRSARTLRVWRKERRIPFIKVGNRAEYVPEEVEAALLVNVQPYRLRNGVKPTDPRVIDLLWEQIRPRVVAELKAMLAGSETPNSNNQTSGKHTNFNSEAQTKAA
jgi:hypothetical protein